MDKRTRYSWTPSYSLFGSWKCCTCSADHWQEDRRSLSPCLFVHGNNFPNRRSILWQYVSVNHNRPHRSCQLKNPSRKAKKTKDMWCGAPLTAWVPIVPVGTGAQQRQSLASPRWVQCQVIHVLDDSIKFIQVIMSLTTTDYCRDFFRKITLILIGLNGPMGLIG